MNIFAAEWIMKHDHRGPFERWLWSGEYRDGREFLLDKPYAGEQVDEMQTMTEKYIWLDQNLQILILMGDDSKAIYVLKAWRRKEMI